jgi:hypothetical protein
MQNKILSEDFLCKLHFSRPFGITSVSLVVVLRDVLYPLSIYSVCMCEGRREDSDEETTDNPYFAPLRQKAFSSLSLCRMCVTQICAVPPHFIRTDYFSGEFSHIHRTCKLPHNSSYDHIHLTKKKNCEIKSDYCSFARE